MPDNDSIVLKDLGETVTMIDVQYRLAEPADRIDMKEERDRALAEYGKARDKLLADGVICTDEHIVEMRKIKAEIEQAAKAQQIIQGMLRLVKFLRGFTV